MAQRRSSRREEPRPPPTENEAWERLLNWLGLAPRSERQILQRLRRWRVDDEAAARLVDRLRAVGLLDDEALAGGLAREYSRKGLWGRAVEARLRERGISPELAGAATADACPPDPLDEAVTLVRRRLRRGAPADGEARRLLAYLQRRGFPADVARRAVSGELALASDDD